MVFYNKDKDGPMKQYTIVTQIIGYVPTDTSEHDNRVNEFNSEHTVFFNQSNSIMTGDILTLVTVCLYADGPEQPTTTKKGVV